MDFDKLLMQMPERGMRQGAAVGDLPPEAVIGMTYTPMQRTNSQKYEPGAALSRGTLYPGLEMPWCNNFNVKQVQMTPLGELQALDFCITDLSLYLDTHPEDREALALLRAYQKAHQEKLDMFVRRYGPMTQHNVSDSDSYDWINDPWPWELGRRDRNV